MDDRFVSDEVADVVNRAGRHPVVLVCEHASHFIPEKYAGLGLNAAAAKSHAAWDPGAEETAIEMSRIMDAPLVRSRVSRLVYDCNRPPDAESAMPERSEVFEIPGNANLTQEHRNARAAEVYFPFRNLLSEVLDERDASPVVVTIHSFTPVYNGNLREVEVGFLHDTDQRLADEMLVAFSGYVVRRNEPYGPEDGVTHTLKEHALPRGCLNVMVEVRNDLIRNSEQCRAMAERLSSSLSVALERLLPNSVAAH